MIVLDYRGLNSILENSVHQEKMKSLCQEHQSDYVIWLFKFLAFISYLLKMRHLFSTVLHNSYLGVILLGIIYSKSKIKGKAVSLLKDGLAQEAECE